MNELLDFQSIDRSRMAEALFYISGLLSYLTPRAKPPTPKQVMTYLTGQYVDAWTKASQKALSSALDQLAKQSGPLDATDISSFLNTLSEILGTGWETELSAPIRKGMTLRYVLAKKGVRKINTREHIQRKRKKVAGVEVNWEQIDEQAVEWLIQDNLYWVGTHYSRNMGEEIAQIATDIGLKQGLGRKEVAKELEKVLGDRFSRSVVYWEGMAATALTRASVMGTTQGLVEAKAKTYKFLAVADERTSPICLHLNNKEFEVKVAVDTRDRLLAAQSPEEAKSVIDWPSGDRLKQVFETDGASELAKMGVAVPPLHFHCRSQIIVSGF